RRREGPPVTRRIRLPLMILATGLLLPADARPAAPLRKSDPADLAARIDRRLAVRFEAEGVTPAPRADDAEFLRRAYLDVTGRIPRSADVHEFLADTSIDRRAKLIDQLLQQPRFAVHFANVWRADLLPETTSPQGGPFKVGFERWLMAHFRAGTRYDRVV